MIRTRKGAAAIEVLLAVIAILLVLNLLHGIGQPAQAQREAGRYAIGAFAYQDEDGKPHSGYYRLDTRSGFTIHRTKSE